MDKKKAAIAYNEKAIEYYGENYTKINYFK